MSLQKITLDFGERTDILELNRASKNDEPIDFEFSFSLMPCFWLAVDVFVDQHACDSSSTGLFPCLSEVKFSIDVGKAYVSLNLLECLKKILQSK
jgi:hypothetical protein